MSRAVFAAWAALLGGTPIKRCRVRRGDGSYGRDDLCSSSYWWSVAGAAVEMAVLRVCNRSGMWIRAWPSMAWGAM